MSLELISSDTIHKMAALPELQGRGAVPAYVAATFYLNKGKSMSGWNYYSNRIDAFEKLKSLSGVPGAKNVTPSGSISFNTNGTAAETAGINCDFFFPYANYIITVPFAALLAYPLPLQGIVTFYKTNGSGPYHAIYDRRFFSASATKIDNMSPDKYAAMQDFYGDLALVKGKYNTLVTFLNELAQKELDPATQAIFNRGVLQKDAMYQQILQIKGINIVTDSTGGIGVIIIPVIVWLVILAIGGWALNTFNTERAKTQRIIQSNDQVKWLLNEQATLQQLYNQGKLTKEQYQQDMQNIGASIKTANDVATQSSKESSLTGDISSMLKWGVVGFIIIKGMDLVKSK